MPHCWTARWKKPSNHLLNPSASSWCRFIHAFNGENDNLMKLKSGEYEERNINKMSLFAYISWSSWTLYQYQRRKRLFWTYLAVVGAVVIHNQYWPWLRIQIHFQQQSSNKIDESLAIKATVVYLKVKIAINTHRRANTPSSWVPVWHSNSAWHAAFWPASLTVFYALICSRFVDENGLFSTYFGYSSSIEVSQILISLSSAFFNLQSKLQVILKWPHTDCFSCYIVGSECLRDCLLWYFDIVLLIKKMIHLIKIRGLVLLFIIKYPVKEAF